MTCRVALLRMQADGLITLPHSQLLKPRGKPHFPPTPATDPQTPVQQPVHELGPLTLRPISGTAPSRLWNEHIARYHCLGYTPMSGSQMRYNIFAGERLVALLSFGASAWKLKARENFVGWSEAQRQHNLQLVVNNARFLICRGFSPRGWHQKYWPRRHARCLRTGWHVTDFGPCCLRHLSSSRATAALATRPPTGNGFTEWLPSVGKKHGAAQDVVRAVQPVASPQKAVGTLLLKSKSDCPSLPILSDPAQCPWNHCRVPAGTPVRGAPAVAKGAAFFRWCWHTLA
jgi:hypothetical protein